MKEITVTEPVFAHAFACTGGECRDHCCKGWSITLDKPAVKRYLKSSHSEIRSIAGANIETTRESFQRWGKIKLVDYGSCAFMDEEGWCKIHKNLGASALSNTCATYPRVQKIFKNEVQKSVQLSCPEATRLLLTREDAMLLQTEKRIQPETNAAPALNQEKQLLNLMCATIMKHSGVNIAEGFYGIAKLFLLSEKYQADSNKVQQLESLLFDIINSLEDGSAHTGLAQFKPDNDLQWALVLRLLTYFSSKTDIRSWGTLNFYINKLLSLLAESAKSSTTRQLMVKLNRVWHQQVVPQLSEKGLFIENYIQYRIYNDAFPGYENRTDMESLYLLVAEWFLLKSLISACALLDGEVVADDFINIIYSFHTLTKHNTQSVKAFFDEINKTKVQDDISLIYLLV